MDSFNPYGRQQDPNHVPRSAVAAQQVHIGGGRYSQSSASTHLHSARPAAGFYSPGAGAPTPTTGGYTAAAMRVLRYLASTARRVGG